MSLDQAIQNLKAARPDPAKVEAITAETIKRRETPYEVKDIFDSPSYQIPRSPGTHTQFACRLCGATLYVALKNNRPLLPDPHLDWHNNLERRLQQLEER